MFTGASYDQLTEQVKPQAEKRIQSRLVLEAVVEAEKIETSEEDFEKEVARLAEAYKMETDQVKEMIGEKGKEEIMKDLAVNKSSGICNGKCQGEEIITGFNILSMARRNPNEFSTLCH